MEQMSFWNESISVTIKKWMCENNKHRWKEEHSFRCRKDNWLLTIYKCCRCSNKYRIDVVNGCTSGLDNHVWWKHIPVITPEQDNWLCELQKQDKLYFKFY